VSFSDRWTACTAVDRQGGSADVVALLRRAADYLETLATVEVAGLELRREPTGDGEVLRLTALFDHSTLPTEVEYLDPRFAVTYDAGEEPREDYDFMLALAAELGARTIVDLGCGTGRLATYLATEDRHVIALDPGAAMIDVARTRVGAERVEWRVGDAGAIGTPEADLVVMTGNISGYIVEDSAWDDLLRAVHAALGPGGYLAFGSRNTEGKAWERWNSPNADYLGVDGDRVRVDWHISLAEGEELVASSEFRFRTRTQLVDSLTRAGFAVEHIYGDWLRAPVVDGSEEFIFVVRRRS
jgi:SAM-dependent methyltransferase